MKARSIKRLIISLMITGMSLTGCVTINHGGSGPPPWAPAHGFHNSPRYVYYPGYNMYYDVRMGVYIRKSGDRWVRSRTLPPGITKQELNGARRVERNSLPSMQPGSRGQAKPKGSPPGQQGKNRKHK